jgi:hypothetical protein
MQAVNMQLRLMDPYTSRVAELLQKEKRTSSENEELSGYTSSMIKQFD